MTRKGNAASTVGHSEIRTAPPGDVRRSRVLVVDDEPSICSSFRRLFESRGFSVDAAESGNEALRLFEQGHYDAVLSDVAMPDGGGLDLLRQVHALDPDVPFILMTAAPSVATAVRALEYGALEYLEKPIGVDELMQALTRASRLRRMTLVQREATDLLEDSASGSERVGLVTTFESALSGLWMAFQPIVSVRERRVLGYEALLRSSEPALPHAGAVLDAAEKLNRVSQVGRVTREHSAVAMADAPDQMLFVNLHPRDLFDPDLLDPASALALMAPRVVLEVTERDSLDTGQHVKERIGKLRSMGFRIAIDDLGAGYAGLSSLATLEPDVLKLDMSLVRGVHLNRMKQKLVTSMTRLAKEMATLVVAEGIESVEECDTLVELGCDLMQGYLFAKPGRPFPTVAF